MLKRMGENYRAEGDLRLRPSCVRQVQQKDFRYAGSSKAAGAERSLWRELSAAPGGGLGSLPHHEFFVFA